MTFNPILEKRNQQYTVQELKTFWQGPGRIVQRTKEQNPALYAELHAEGERLGVLGKSLAPNPAPNVYRVPTKSYTPGELTLRGQFTEAYCRQLFASGSSKEATELFNKDREAYEDAKDAAIAFDILPARLTPRPQPAPVAAPEPLHRVSDQLAKESNLPLGTELPWSQVQQLCQQQVDRARKAQADADAKAAEARADELAMLTARQQADQAVRDQKQRDLDRLQELIAPKPVETTEPLPLAVARAVAAEKTAA
jgi:hypothetical protein